MILVVNTGSSSLKVKLFSEKSPVFFKSYERLRNLNDYIRAIKSAKAEIIAKNIKQKISKIAHRVVHGAELKSPLIIKSRYDLRKIKEHNQLAPLHNPKAIAVLEASMRLFPESEQIAIFDTGFFSDLPPIAKTLPINLKISQKYGIRKFGFHGISHQYMAMQVDPENKQKLITVHLGAGCSIAAIECGRPIDTSMSFTPLDGLIMQSRSGSLDPGLVLFLVKKLGVSKAETLLNNESGLAGLTNTDGDMKQLFYNAGYPISDQSPLYESHKKPTEEEKFAAREAIEKYCYEIGKMIAAYDYALSGADRVVFSGRIGFGSKLIRDKIGRRREIKASKIIIIQPDEETAMLNQII